LNTPAHLLIGAAVFGRPVRSTVILAALFGSALPDLSLYILAGAAMHVWGIPPQTVFDELYFSQAWQTVFAIDNSLIVWGCLCAVAALKRSDWGLALTGAALLHGLCDLPLHHDDGRPHFWPLTPWVFESPFSYWDRARGATWIAPLEGVIAAAACGVLWLRDVPAWVRAVSAVLLALEVWVIYQWLFVFGTA